jgi:hypothetical protein
MESRHLLTRAAAAALHDRFRRGMRDQDWKPFLERTGAMDGDLDAPGVQAAMDGVLDPLRASLKRA